MSFVYYVPSVSQNVSSIKKFCKDNNCVICFDDYSSIVKDKVTGSILLRYEFVLPLYPFRDVNAHLRLTLLATLVSEITIGINDLDILTILPWIIFISL